MRDRRSFVVRLASAIALLAALCACDVIQRVTQPPAPAPPPPVAQPPAAQPPIAVAPGAQGLPIASGLPIPPGMPFPSAIPQPGQSLLSTRPPPDYATLAAPPPGAIDASGHLTLAWMTSESSSIYETLRAALFAEQRARVAQVPFHVVPDPLEPNAAAGCTPGTGRPIVFITSAMLVLAGAAAEARALDELGGTTHHETYARHVVHWLRSEEPIGALPSSIVAGALARDPRKLARQRHLFVQQVAFILGHELAHHHRGHTSCTSAASASRADAEALQRGLAQAVPTLEQPNEVEADVWGTASVLEAGHALAGGAWTAEGALLNLDVFRHLSNLAGGDVAMVFLSTHPPSELRAPIITMAAQQWQPGRAPLPTPTLTGDGIELDLGDGRGPMRIPIPF